MKRLSRSAVTASALVALAVTSSACVVPATRYDEARSALALEQQANRTAGARLYEMEAKVAALQAQIDKRQHELDVQSERVAQSQLDTSVAARKQQDATELVDQLREELERVGDHLRAFADQKQELGQALDAAEARIKRLSEVEREASERALVVRDLSLLLRDAIATGDVELSMSEGRPVLRVPRARILDDAREVKPEGKTLLAAVARASQLHPGSSVVLAERGKSDGETAEQSATGLQHISDALAGAGLSAKRVTIDVPAEHAAPAQATAAADAGGSAPTAAKDAQPAAKPSMPAEATIEIAIETSSSS